MTKDENQSSDPAVSAAPPASKPTSSRGFSFDLYGKGTALSNLAGNGEGLRKLVDSTSALSKIADHASALNKLREHTSVLSNPTRGGSALKGFAGVLRPLLDQQRADLGSWVSGALPTFEAAAMFGNVFPYSAGDSMLGPNALRNLRPVETWLTQFTKSLPSLLPDLTNFSPAVPENLASANVSFDFQFLKQLMLEEGLPLAWVPRPDTIDLILAADTPGKRRAVYGSRWRGIVADCEDLLMRMKSAELAQFAQYGLKAAEGLRAGHHELAQSFSASTLDTFLSTVEDKKELTRATRDDVDEFPIRMFFIACQLSGIHKRYFPEKGDVIPSTFNRHGSAHGVSRRQYSRLNAVLGLCHLTSALWWGELRYTRRKQALA